MTLKRLFEEAGKALVKHGDIEVSVRVESEKESDHLRAAEETAIMDGQFTVIVSD